MAGKKAGETTPGIHGPDLPASDILLLKACVQLAEMGRYTCAPNPTVGCIIVRQGEIIGRGFHARAGEGHAEVQAINHAGGDIKGAAVYVSLEPCAFVGRTPACAQTLIDAQVSRVILAAVDPHPQVAGKGIEMLRAAGVVVDVHTLPDAVAAIQGYAHRLTRHRPWVRLKTASSVDGAVALNSGESQWITGPQARLDAQHLRARSDAIVTGVGTVTVDDPLFTVRLDCPFKQPLRVVLDSHGRTPQDAHVVSDEHSTLIVHKPSQAPSWQPNFESGNVECCGLDPRNLAGLLAVLAERGCNEVLVEAGPKVVGSFLKSGLWDEWVAYLAPKALGNAQSLADFDLASLADAPDAQLVSETRVGKDLRLTLVPTHE